MKNNSKTTFIIVAGIIVLVVFVSVLSINLLPNYESNSYFVKVGDEMSAKIETLNIDNESQDKVRSLQLMAKRIGKKSIVFLISDFMTLEESLKHEITALSFTNELCLINVYDNILILSHLILVLFRG